MAWIELDGAVNARDLGGLPTEDGGKTADARLLRADNLQELSPSDIAVLVGEIGVTTEVDLRSSSELAAEGRGPLGGVAGVRHTHHPVLPEAGVATDAASLTASRSCSPKRSSPDHTAHCTKVYAAAAPMASAIGRCGENSAVAIAPIVARA